MIKYLFLLNFYSFQHHIIPVYFCPFTPILSSRMTQSHTQGYWSHTKWLRSANAR
jgi:hypothetical protein